jgi:outer membrane protein TolC
LKKIILSIFILITSTSYAFGIVDTNKITIQQAVEIASKNNLDMQSSRLNLSIEKNNILSSNRLQNPDVGVYYNLGKAGKGNPQEIGLTQTIEIAKRGARKNLAKSNYELTQKNIEYLEIDLRMDVREAYTNLLAKKSVLKTFQNEEELLTKLLNVAKEMYKTGKVQEIDVLQAQLLLNQIRTEVNSAKYDVKTALYEFNKVINTPDGFYDTVENSFTEDYRPLAIPKPSTVMPDFEQISANAISNRVDIKIAQQEIEVAQKDLELVLKQKIPDLEIEGGYGYQNKSQSEDGTFKHGAFVGVSLVNLPLLYSYKPEIQNAKLKLEQAHLNYSSVENKALNDLKKAYEKFLTAQINLKYYNEELLSDSEALIKVSRKNYKEGKIDLTTLISMEESYRMIIIAHTYALADYYNAWNFFVREVNNENFNVENL